MMAHHCLKEIEDGAIGTAGTDLFVDAMPDSPASCVAFYDETAPSLDESSALGVDNFGVQVLVRDPSYTAARDKAFAIHKLLAGFGGGVQLGGQGPLVTAISPVNVPASIGKDGDNNTRFSSHYTLRVTSDSESNREAY